VKPPKALFKGTWVHVFEEDGPEGQVYRPSSGKVPLSRRPRRRISFSPDGSARVVVAGEDDRLHELEAHWTEKDGEITVAPKAGVMRGKSKAAFEPLRFEVKAKDRLVLRRATSRAASP
jgi:hypothetical protein